MPEAAHDIPQKAQQSSKPQGYKHSSKVGSKSRSEEYSYDNRPAVKPLWYGGICKGDVCDMSQSNQPRLVHAAFKEMVQEGFKELEGEAEDNFFTKEAKKYTLVRIKERIKYKEGLPDILDVPGFTLGLTFHMGGAIVKAGVEPVGEGIEAIGEKIEEKYPKVAAVGRSVFEEVKAGANYIGEKVSKGVEYGAEKLEKGYVKAKAELIEGVRKEFGEKQAIELEKRIEAGEEWLGYQVKKQADKWSPTEEQGYLIKGFELLGLAKVGGMLAKQGMKMLRPDIDSVGKPLFKFPGHFINVPDTLLKPEVNFPKDYNSPKLRAKFEFHKHDFGLDRNINYNKNNADLFIEGMAKHVKNDGTVAIAGTYRGTEKVVHHYNPKTEVNVMKDLNGNWISGWKLSQAQINSLMRKGNIQ